MEWNGSGASYFWQPLSSTSKHSAVFLAPLANSTCAQRERRRAKYEQKVDKETVPASEIILYTLCICAFSLSATLRGDYSRGEGAAFS